MVDGVDSNSQGVMSDAQLAIVVHQFENSNLKDDGLVEEIKLLAISSGAIVCGTLTTVRRVPVNASYIGKGKLEELLELVNQCKADIVLFNHSLSPIQERNLQKFLKIDVIDRTRLILDIFALRAASHAGKLQVELAQLKHLSTRLIRGWTHLERQKGGIGLRGPGETQLETDRRLIDKRIKTLNMRLQKVGSHRSLQRRSRERIPLPVISLVGYTNAGKSTLFNRLTKAKVYTANKLFSTLDPVMRKMQLSSGENIIVSDTVGFIQQLPHSLISAFHSTLEEVSNASLLLHVVDVSNSNYHQFIDEVDEVLKEIDADKIEKILVFNKIDNIDKQPAYQPANDQHCARVWLSGKSAQGIDLLRKAVSDNFQRHKVNAQLILTPEKSRIRALVYDNNWVKSEEIDDDGVSKIQISLNTMDYNRLIKDKEIAKYLKIVNLIK